MTIKEYKEFILTYSGFSEIAPKTATLLTFLVFKRGEVKSNELYVNTKEIKYKCKFANNAAVTRARQQLVNMGLIKGYENIKNTTGRYIFFEEGVTISEYKARLKENIIEKEVM